MVNPVVARRARAVESPEIYVTPRGLVALHRTGEGFAARHNPAGLVFASLAFLAFDRAALLSLGVHAHD